MREALFSILGSVDGLRVLDLYAGSGALGIEALSRGAGAATFVESARTALAAIIDENLAALGEDAARSSGATRWRGCGAADDERASTSFSAIRPMMLPPASRSRSPNCCRAWRRREALIVTESSKRNPLALDLPLTDERTYGDTRIAIHRGR